MTQTAAPWLVDRKASRADATRAAWRGPSLLEKRHFKEVRKASKHVTVKPVLLSLIYRKTGTVRRLLRAAVPQTAHFLGGRRDFQLRSKNFAVQVREEGKEEEEREKREKRGRERREREGRKGRRI
jgi:hypothetical protein